MKKLFLTMCIALVSVVAFAQQGEKAVCVNLSYGTEISNLGIGVKGQYGLTDAIRLEAGFDYFLKKDYLSMWDINVNAHYLFPINEKFKVYPLVGLTYTSWSLDGEGVFDDVWEGVYDYDDYYDEEEDGSNSSGKFGVNLGAGIQYDITDKWAVNFELKYQLISDFNQAVFGLGIAYKF